MIATIERPTSWDRSVEQARIWRDNRDVQHQVLELDSEHASNLLSFITSNAREFRLNEIDRYHRRAQLTRREQRRLSEISLMGPMEYIGKAPLAVMLRLLLTRPQAFITPSGRYWSATMARGRNGKPWYILMTPRGATGFGGVKSKRVEPERLMDPYDRSWRPA